MAADHDLAHVSKLAANFKISSECLAEWAVLRMNKLKQSFREIRQARRTKSSENPAIENLMDESDTGSPFEELEKLRKKPANKAREALDQLFRQAQGIEGRGRYEAALSDVKPVEGGDAAALEAYSRLVCEHVENLTSLVESHTKHLLPVSRKRFTWPILRSEHPLFSQDENEIFKMLQVGKGKGRYFDRFSKWKLSGKIPLLVDELIWWADACKQKPTLKQNWFSWQSIYFCNKENCPHPVVARMRRHLQRHQKSAARLKSLDQESVEAWERLFVALLKDCFKDSSCATFLRLNFAARSKDSPGKAKEYLIRKVSERLKTFAGIKR